jgi:hypothetical protein
MIRTRRVATLLPPYSPDLNPIEMAFSKLKATCVPGPPEPSMNSGRPSQTYATSSNQRSAATSSTPPDMDSSERTRL